MIAEQDLNLRNQIPLWQSPGAVANSSNNGGTTTYFVVLSTVPATKKKKVVLGFSVKMKNEDQIEAGLVL